MKLDGADGALLIRHHLPHRLRVHLATPITQDRLELIAALLEHVNPGLSVRSTAHRRGLVVAADTDQLVCPALVISLVELSLQAPDPHGPSVPPSAWQRWLGSTRQGSIKVLMALAVAGWALPVLPGTPFFLLAWWLGWRPQPSTEAELQPSGLEASA